MGKYKLALKDFRQVCKLEPKDKQVNVSATLCAALGITVYYIIQARARLKECEKAAKAQSFAEAIESEETAPFGT